MQLCNAFRNYSIQLCDVKIHSQSNQIKMKKFIFLISLAGIIVLLNSCSTTGYVTTEPTYVEYSRPTQPSINHIWIDGDWQYRRPTHVYVQKRGYWSRPSQGRTYQKGNWQSSPQGKSWNKGQWKKNDRKDDRKDDRNRGRNKR